MAKKEKIKKEEKIETPLPDNMPKIPPEMEKKLKAIKIKLDNFQKEVVKKFDKYIMAISILPPPPAQELEKMKEEERDKIHTLILVDDSDSKTMTKIELHQKLSAIINEIAQKTDKKIMPDVLLLSEVWQNCYDGKYDLLNMVASSAPIYDLGMLQAIKIAEVHKTMVIKKFEKYIVSYVLAGSLTQGRSTKTSDIDVWIVIDDTDVKKMTRVELKDKLRAIIIGMGIEAGEMTGIKNKLNIQVYILTDFWDSLKEANPIIFTLLRDGVPFYDRGVFMPWKLLLKMGRIKPSSEAIEMFMSSGEQMLDRVGYKLKDIGMEDIYYAILTPSQAALMLFGVPPPTPRETPEMMREIFVKKEKLLEASFVDILEKNITIRKEIEHGTKKELSGKEVDTLLANSKKYLERIKKLFKQIETIKQEEDAVHVYESIITITRDVLKSEDVESVKDDEIIKTFDRELIEKGKVPAKFSRILSSIIDAKKDYDEHKLNKTEVEKIKKDSREYIKAMVEYIQRKRGRELESAKIKVKYGNKYGEIVVLKGIVFIVHDINSEEKEISKAKLSEDGSFVEIDKSSLEEIEQAISKEEVLPRAAVNENMFAELKKIFGKDIEIMVGF